MMNPPLLEAVLELRFEAEPLSQEKLRYFLTAHPDLVAASKKAREIVLQSIDHTMTLTVATTHVELCSRAGQSYSRLRPTWTAMLDSLVDLLGISEISGIALTYLNEIPLQELKSFRNHLNIGFEMPTSLKERLALFRSEFTFRSGADEIRVWIQPEWDDQTEGYSVQLTFESRATGSIGVESLPEVAQRLHAGIKEVFHEIVSQDYIRQLPQ